MGCLYHNSSCESYLSIIYTQRIKIHTHPHLSPLPTPFLPPYSLSPQMSNEKTKEKFVRTWGRRSRVADGERLTDHELLVELLFNEDGSNIIAVKLPGVTERIELSDGAVLELKAEDDYRVVCTPSMLKALIQSFVIHTDHAFKIDWSAKNACVLTICVYDPKSGLKRVVGMAYCSTKSSYLVAAILHHLRAAALRVTGEDTIVKLHIHDCVLADGAAVRSALGKHVREQFCLWHVYDHTVPLFSAAAIKGGMSKAEAEIAVTEWRGVLEHLSPNMFALGAFAFAKKYQSNKPLRRLLSGATVNRLEAYALFNVSDIPGVSPDNMIAEGEFSSMRRATEALTPTGRRGKFVNASSFLEFLLKYLHDSDERFQTRSAEVIARITRQERLAPAVAVARLSSASSSTSIFLNERRRRLDGASFIAGPQPLPSHSGFEIAAGGGGGPLVPVTARGANEAFDAVSASAAGLFEKLICLCGGTEVPLTWSRLFDMASKNDSLCVETQARLLEALDVQRGVRESRDTTSGAGEGAVGNTSSAADHVRSLAIRNALLNAGSDTTQPPLTARYLALLEGGVSEGETALLLPTIIASPNTFIVRQIAADAWASSPTPAALARIVELTNSVDSLPSKVAVEAPIRRQLIVDGRPSKLSGTQFRRKALRMCGSLIPFVLLT